MSDIRMVFAARRAESRGRRRDQPRLEPLETRALLANVAVDATQVIRPAATQDLGVNLAWWDTSLTTPQTAQLVQNAGLNLFRFPGGSSSDEYHFNDPPSYQGKGTIPQFAQFVAAQGGQAVVTLDYGSGSPQEAAAFLAYLNAPVGNTTALGTGQRWNDSTQAWVATDWKTAGYWASLRAATPLATDDGLNFLRIGRTAPFGFHDYEVGNEVYGSWETDHHGQGGDTGRAHDPATYVAFAKQFATYAASIDPSISIGVDTGSVGQDNGWTQNVLQLGANQGFVPGFLSDHHYMQAPGQESDSNLLLNTSSGTGSQDPTNPMSWSARAAGYRALLQQILGAKAGSVQLLATEFNSVYSNPGKQTTSLVNGLFLADSLGSLLGTEYNGAVAWDLRNSYDTGNNNSSSLYGWRQGGDYGLLGSSGPSPATGVYTPYPTYFAEQLVSRMVQPGANVIRVSTDDPNLATYAVRESNGHLDLLVINKSATTDLAGTFRINGFTPSAQATAYQYGKAQDNAQANSSTGQSALATFTANLAVSGSQFSTTFPSYSMTVLDLTPTGSGGGGGGGTNPTNQPPTVAKAASATPAPVTGTTTTLTTLGADDGGEANLTYTWSTVGTVPAAVAFSSNATNSSKTDTATFTKAGSYTFLVTITDSGGLSTTSSVTVLINQTLTSIVVSPGTASLKTGQTQQFAAQGFDQFGAPLATAPSFAWSVTGVGSVSSTGLYTAPAAAGTASVRATVGSVVGSASVTVSSTTTTQGGFTATYTVNNDWGTGLTATIVIQNTSTTPINGWTLEFDYPSSITQIWNALVVSHIGNHYVIRDAGYNAAIPAGQSVSFGFNASRSGPAASPTGYILNGVGSGGGTTTPPTPPPTTDLAASARYQVTNDWGTGFTGNVTLTNTGTTSFTGWTFAFDFAANISQIWGATIVSHIGNHYIIQDAGYDATIAAGQAISFGLVASRADNTSGPAIAVFTDATLTSGTKKKTFPLVNATT